MPSYGQQQQPAGVLKKGCGCPNSCDCNDKKDIPGIENDLPYKGNAVLNAQKL